MEMSIREKMQALEEKLANVEKDAKAMQVACDDYKVENEALKEQVAQANAAIQEKDEAYAEEVDQLKAELEEKDVALVDANESIEQMKANMELSPAAEVIEGAEPVADGSANAEDVDYVAEMNKLSGAEKIAYYRANSEKIDAAFRS